MNLPQEETINQYLADGVETVYNFDYLVPLEGDIEVYVTLAGDPPIPSADRKVLNVDYTVQINTLPLVGGTITFTVAPANNSIVTLSRNVEASIDTSYVDARNINGENLDDDFERVTLVAQQNKTFLEQRALRYAVNSYLPNETTQESNTIVPIITDVDNQIWKSQTGTIIATVLEENPDVGTLRTDLANETPGGDGAGIVGFFDELNVVPTTVRNALNELIARVYPSGKTIPIGSYMDFAGFTVGDGFLECDGSAVSRSTYSDLYSAITMLQTGTLTNGANTVTGLSSTAKMRVGMHVEGTNIPASTTIATIASGTAITLSQNATGSGSTSIRFFVHGSGNGTTTFNVPNLSRKARVGAGGTPTATLASTPGATGGAETNTLTEPQMPVHTHAFTHHIYDKPNAAASGGDVPIPANIGDPGAAEYNGFSMTISNAGGSGGITQPHNIMQPSMVSVVGIKY